MANVPQPEAMEDILSSIRTTLAEETAKVGTGSDDLIDAAAKQDGEEDDVLELTPAEMVPEAKDAPKDEEALIDLEAFASKGESKPADPTNVPQEHDELTTPPQADAPAEPAATGPEAAEAETDAAAEAPVAKAGGEATAEEAADEFDRLLAEISQEQETQAAAVEEHKQALLAEEEPLGASPAVETPEAAPAAPEQPMVAPEQVSAVAEQVVAQEVKGTAAAAPAAAAVTYTAQATPGAVPQVAFPAEVLAMALRPMVQEWLAQNLPGVVEKLVKDEIDKLSQG